MISHYISASSKPSVQGSAAVLFCLPLILGRGKRIIRGEKWICWKHTAKQSASLLGAKVYCSVRAVLHIEHTGYHLRCNLTGGTNCKQYCFKDLYLLIRNKVLILFLFPP